MSVVISPKIMADQARDELLASNGWFADIPVISADPGDIETAINTALEQLAIGVLICPVSFKRNRPNLNLNRQGPYFDEALISVIITENNTLNRPAAGVEGVDYITAQDLAMLVASVLDWFQPGGISEMFKVTEIVPVPFPRPDADDQPSLNMWTVFLTAGAGIAFSKGRVAPVTFAQSGGQVTLSCATPGASIWFTLDGATYPAPSNPNAHLAVLQPAFQLDASNNPVLDGAGQPIVTNQVSFPIPVSTGTKLAARGWLAGLNSQPTPNDQQIYRAT